VDLVREEAFSQRAKGNKADSQPFENRNDLRLRLPPPKGVFALKCGDRLDGVRAPNGLHSRFGKAEVLNLALLNQVLHRSRYVLDGNVRVYTVLIEQIDDIGPEPLERGFGHLLDMFRTAVQPGLFAGLRIEFEAELRCNHDFLAHRSEG